MQMAPAATLEQVAAKFKQAIAAEPSCAEAHSSLALIYAKLDAASQRSMMAKLVGKGGAEMESKTAQQQQRCEEGAAVCDQGKQHAGRAHEVENTDREAAGEDGDGGGGDDRKAAGVASDYVELALRHYVSALVLAPTHLHALTNYGALLLSQKSSDGSSNSRASEAVIPLRKAVSLVHPRLLAAAAEAAAESAAATAAAAGPAGVTKQEAGGGRERLARGLEAAAGGSGGESWARSYNLLAAALLKIKSKGNGGGGGKDKGEGETSGAEARAQAEEGAEAEAEAEAVYRKALAVDPGHEHLRYKLANLLWRREKEQARERKQGREHERGREVSIGVDIGASSGAEGGSEPSSELLADIVDGDSITAKWVRRAAGDAAAAAGAGARAGVGAATGSGSGSDTGTGTDKRISSWYSQLLEDGDGDGNANEERAEETTSNEEQEAQEEHDRVLIVTVATKETATLGMLRRSVRAFGGSTGSHTGNSEGSSSGGGSGGSGDSGDSGVRLVVLGMGVTPFRYSLKVELPARWLAGYVARWKKRRRQRVQARAWNAGAGAGASDDDELHGQPLVIFVDAYDVLLVPSGESLVRRFLRVTADAAATPAAGDPLAPASQSLPQLPQYAPVLFGAEHGCYPDPALARFYPSATHTHADFRGPTHMSPLIRARARVGGCTCYEYLNSGAYAAFALPMLQMLQAAMRSAYQPINDDQRLFTRYMLHNNRVLAKAQQGAMGEAGDGGLGRGGHGSGSGSGWWGGDRSVSWPAAVQLDHQNGMFQSLYKEERANFVLRLVPRAEGAVTLVSRLQLVNTKTGHAPCLLHGHGGAKEKLLLAQLSLELECVSEALQRTEADGPAAAEELERRLAQSPGRRLLFNCGEGTAELALDAGAGVCAGYDI
eukprot:g2373.t1